jgi:hypothetical protein
MFFKEMMHVNLTEAIGWGIISAIAYFYFHWWVVSMFLLASGVAAFMRGLSYWRLTRMVTA